MTIRLMQKARPKRKRNFACFLSLTLLLLLSLVSIRLEAKNLGQGPFNRLVIRGVTIIDGTGGPPYGPSDVVVEGDRITAIEIVSHPLEDIDQSNRPALGEHEIDAHGMYLLPGFIDSHVHIPGPSSSKTGLSTAYYYYLNLAHGITSVVDVVSSEDLAWTVNLSSRVRNNEVVAPRVFPYARLSVDGYPVRFNFKGIVNTPNVAREWVRAAAEAGAVGLKLRGNPPKITEVIIDEAKKLGLKTTMHLEQRGIGMMNLVDSARMGLDRQDHWYGLAESMLAEQSIPYWATDYIYNNEQDRWRDAGRVWQQAAKPGTSEWTTVMEELLTRDFTIAPTSVFYDYLRDPMRRRQLEWHKDFSSPALLKGWEIGPGVHPGILDWKTEDEANWHHFFYKWQQFLKEFNRRGGRIVVGSDAGSGYNLYGFGLIREMELLQQAGLNSTEVIRSATLYGAEFLGVDDKLGTIRTGKIADLVLVDENPLVNLKVLYGIGHLRYSQKSGETERIGGVKYTIRGGVVYDAVQMREEIKKMVRNAKK